MLEIENHIGSIAITDNYLRQLIENTVLGCFGITGICPASPADAVIAKFFPQYDKKGIVLYTDEKRGIIIDLHIAVAFGTNISAVVRSVAHKVKFAVSQAVRDADCQINIFVDDINS